MLHNVKRSLHATAIIVKRLVQQELGESKGEDVARAELGGQRAEHLTLLKSMSPKDCEKSRVHVVYGLSLMKILPAHERIVGDL